MTEDLTVFEHLFLIKSDNTSANAITVILPNAVTKLISSARTFQVPLCQEQVKTLLNSLISGGKK